MATKNFPTLAVASAATGIGLATGITYSDIMEICSHVLGFPVWTHELIDPTLAARVTRSIGEQFPKLPTSGEAHVDWRKAAEAALAAYGETVEVEEGTGKRSEGPVESLARLTGRPEDIIVVSP